MPLKVQLTNADRPGMNLSIFRRPSTVARVRVRLDAVEDLAARRRLSISTYQPMLRRNESKRHRFRVGERIRLDDFGVHGIGNPTGRSIYAIIESAPSPLGSSNRVHLTLRADGDIVDTPAHLNRWSSAPIPRSILANLILELQIRREKFV